MGRTNKPVNVASCPIATTTRGLAVLERAFGDEAQLRKVAAHTIDLILGNHGSWRRGNRR